MAAQARRTLSAFFSPCPEGARTPGRARATWAGDVGPPSAGLCQEREENGSGQHLPKAPWHLVTKNAREAPPFQGGEERAWPRQGPQRSHSGVWKPRPSGRGGRPLASQRRPMAHAESPMQPKEDAQRLLAREGQAPASSVGWSFFPHHSQRNDDAVFPLLTSWDGVRRIFTLYRA